jgi:hypothetical protein
MKQVFQKRLAENHPDFADAYDRAKKSQTAINNVLEAHRDELNPSDTIKRLKYEIECEADSDERLKLANKLAAFQAASIPLQQSANATVATLFTVLEGGVRVMLRRALLAAEQEHAADIEQEKAFYAQFPGVDYSPTPVSARWSRLKADIAGYLASLDTPASRMAMSMPRHDSFSSAFSLFE